MTAKKDLSTTLVNWIASLIPVMRAAYKRAHPIKGRLPCFFDRAFDTGISPFLAKIQTILHDRIKSDREKLSDIMDVLLNKLPNDPSALADVKNHHGKRIAAFVSIKLWQHLFDNNSLLATEKIVLGAERRQKFSNYVPLFDNNLYPNLVAVLNMPFEYPTRAALTRSPGR